MSCSSDQDSYFSDGQNWRGKRFACSHCRPSRNCSCNCHHTSPPKSKKAFIWPRDGRDSYFGRWKDILTCQGPSMYVASRSIDGWDPLSRGERWPRAGNFDPWVLRDNAEGRFPWARTESRERYNPRTRRRAFGDSYSSGDMWPGESNVHIQHPKAFQCAHGQWYRKEMPKGVPPHRCFY